MSKELALVTLPTVWENFDLLHNMVADLSDTVGYMTEQVYGTSTVEPEMFVVQEQSALIGRLAYRQGAFFVQLRHLEAKLAELAIRLEVDVKRPLPPATAPKSMPHVDESELSKELEDALDPTIPSKSDF